jgi:hypothetical protein
MFLKISLTSVLCPFVKAQPLTGRSRCKFHVLAYKLLGLSLLTVAVSVQAETVGVGASKDATIAGKLNTFMDSNYANGGGPRLLVAGDVSDDPIKRSLLEFDIAAAGIPANSRIDSVTLTLTLARVTQPGGGPQTFRLFPLEQNWSDAPPWAAPGGDDGGHPKQRWDVTWDYANWHDIPRFPEEWADGTFELHGGNFSSTPSASTTFSPLPLGSTFIWHSPQMAADVQHWLDGTMDNNGWLLKSDSEAGPLVGFWSSEGALAQGNAALAPRLEIMYTIPEPETYAMLLAGLGLIGAMARRKQRVE